MSEAYELVDASTVVATNIKVLVRRVADGRVAMCKPAWFVNYGGYIYPKNAYNSLRLSVLFLF